MEYNLKQRTKKVLHKSKYRWLIFSVAMLGMLTGLGKPHTASHAAVTKNYKPSTNQLKSSISRKSQLILPHYNSPKVSPKNNNYSLSKTSNVPKNLTSISPTVSKNVGESPNNSISSSRGTFNLKIIKRDHNNNQISSSSVMVPITGPVGSFYDINYKSYMPSNYHLATGSFGDFEVGINSPHSISENHGSFTFDEDNDSGNKDKDYGHVGVDYVDEQSHRLVKFGYADGPYGLPVDVTQQVTLPVGYRYVRGNKTYTIEPPAEIDTIWVQKNSDNSQSSGSDNSHNSSSNTPNVPKANGNNSHSGNNSIPNVPKANGDNSHNSSNSTPNVPNTNGDNNHNGGNSTSNVPNINSDNSHNGGNNALNVPNANGVNSHNTSNNTPNRNEDVHSKSSNTNNVDSRFSSDDKKSNLSSQKSNNPDNLDFSQSATSNSDSNNHKLNNNKENNQSSSSNIDANSDYNDNNSSHVSNSNLNDDSNQSGAVSSDQNSQNSGVTSQQQDLTSGKTAQNNDVIHQNNENNNHLPQTGNTNMNLAAALLLVLGLSFPSLMALDDLHRKL